MADEENKTKEQENEETEETTEETSEETTEETEDKDAKIKELEDELAKEKEKEKNFKGLKDQEKGKRKSLREEIDELKAQQKTEREDRQTMQDSILEDAKENSLEQLAGDDKDYREQLIERVKTSEDYLGPPKDSKQLTERYEKAAGFLKGVRRKVNPIHAHSTVTGSQNETGTGEKRFTDTTDGKELYEKKFPKIAALEKKIKEGK